MADELKCNSPENFKSKIHNSYLFGREGAGPMLHHCEHGVLVCLDGYLIIPFEKVSDNVLEQLDITRPPTAPQYKEPEQKPASPFIRLLARLRRIDD